MESGDETPNGSGSKVCQSLVAAALQQPLTTTTRGGPLTIRNMLTRQRVIGMELLVASADAQGFLGSAGSSSGRSSGRSSSSSSSGGGGGGGIGCGACYCGCDGAVGKLQPCASEDDVVAAAVQMGDELEHHSPESIGEINVCSKRKVIRLLLSYVTANRKLSPIWRALRILSRNSAGLEPFWESDGLSTMVTTLKTHHELECARILFNVALTLSEVVGSHLQQLPVIEALLDALFSSNQEQDIIGAIILSKTLFVMLASIPELQISMRSFYKIKEIVLLIRNNYVDNEQIAIENFKSMFVICSRWWIESHFSPDMEQGIQTTLKDLSPAIQHAIEVSDSSSPLKQAVVEFLVAVPTKYLSVGIFYRQASTPDNSESFSDRGPEEIQTSLQDMALVGNLVGYLQRLSTQPYESSMAVRDAVIPIAVVLRKICRLSTMFRQFIAQTLLPRRKDWSHGPEEGNSPSSWLISQLRSPADTLSPVVGQFLLELCNGNVRRFIRRVGYGNAAGFLVSQGMANPDLSTPPVDIGAVDRSDSDDDDIAADIDLVTGRRSEPASTEWASLEEKEQAAHELLVCIEKLNALGIIQCKLPYPEEKDY
eukprot:gene3581-30_t